MSELFRYLSSKASVDPVKTLIVLPPDDQADSYEAVARFAEASGWIEQAEADGAALMVPVAEDGWGSCTYDLPYQLYQDNRRSFMASHEAIHGRNGAVWMWETLIYVVGYSEGAKLAEKSMLARPGFAAATVLVDGDTNDLSLLDERSSHWLVPNPSDYDLQNRDIPVACWVMGSHGNAGELIDALRDIDGATAERTVDYDSYETAIYENPNNAAQQIRYTPSLSGETPQVARLAMESFFNSIIRWKNGPDGSLKTHISKKAFFSDGTYLHGSVNDDGSTYHYAVYLPKGMAREEAKGLPRVLSMHGRGEPSWIFCQKNGWEELADETRGFVVAIPDSPGNLWNINRDCKAVELMVEQLLAEYDLNRERVYLTGFSNGSLFAFQMATHIPGLFAAASPWNGSADSVWIDGIGDFKYDEEVVALGYEMPMWICFGDSDDKMPCKKGEVFDAVLRMNRCSADSKEVWTATNHYSSARGYVEATDSIRVCSQMMKALRWYV